MTSKITSSGMLQRVGIAFVAMTIAGLLAGCGGSGGSPAAPPAAAITAQPTDQSAVAGSAATFSVTAANATGYQWQRGSSASSTFADVTGATSASHTTAASTPADSGAQYRVVVAGAGGSVTSSAATLTVTAAAVAPSIVVQPAPQTITAGQDATFSVTATGTALTYQWQHSRDGGNSFTDEAGATAATLTLSAVAQLHNGHLLRVVVRNSLGSVTSTAALLAVTPAPIAATIIQQPANQSVTASTEATFSATASGTPAPTLQWQVNDAGTWSDLAVATASSYTTAPTVVGDSGKQYRLIATNAAGSATSNAATLTVSAAPLAPSFEAQPTSVSITVGQSTAFVATASGTPTPSLQWQLSTDNGASWSNITGATGTVFNVTNAALDNSGWQFRAVATNHAGNITSNAATLSVLALPRFAYVTNFNDNTVSMFTVNPVTGQLRHNGYVLTGTNAQSIAVDPAGKFAYVVFGVGNVATYSINASTGVLTSAGVAVAAGTSPYSVTVDPTGRFAYVANFGSANVSAYTINATTGALTSVGTVASGAQPLSVTVDPTGRFAYVATNGGALNTYTIEPTLGILTSVGTINVASGRLRAVTVDPLGKFALVVNSDETIQPYAINPGTGALTAFGNPLGTGGLPVSVTVDPTGRFAYVANFTSSNVSAYTINPASGGLNPIGTVAAGINPSAVSIDASGKFAYVTNQGGNTISSYRINPGTGALTALATVVGRSGPSSIAMTKGPSAVSYTPKFAYVVASSAGTGSVSGFGIDAGTGVLSAVAGSPFGGGVNSMSLATNPAGTFVYVANYASSLTGLAIAANGSLSTLPGSPYAAPASQFAWAGAVDPSGRFVYYANYNNAGPGSVSAFTVTPSTGVLTAIPGSAFAAGAGPADIAIHPTGRFAYVTNTRSNSVSAYTIDALSGVLTRMDADPLAAGVQDYAAGSFPSKVAVDPSGRFAYVINVTDSVSIYAISAMTGALTQLDADPNVAGVQNFARGAHAAIAIEPSGRYAYLTQVNGFNTLGVYAINAVTGTITLASSAPTGVYPRAVTIDAAGHFAYVTNYTDNSVSAYRIDATTGALTALIGSPFPVTGATTPIGVVSTGSIQ